LELPAGTITQQETITLLTSPGPAHDEPA